MFALWIKLLWALDILDVTIEMIAEDAVQMLRRSQALRFFQYDVRSN